MTDIPIKQLREIEWAGCAEGEGEYPETCPVCKNQRIPEQVVNPREHANYKRHPEYYGHKTDCWLGRIVG